MSSKVPTRPLGSSGIDITPVGFGAWAIGRRRMELRVGAAGRYGLACRDAPGGGAGRQLD